MGASSIGMHTVGWTASLAASRQRLEGGSASQDRAAAYSCMLQILVLYSKA
jgi:hypothetical protein